MKQDVSKAIRQADKQAGQAVPIKPDARTPKFRVTDWKAQPMSKSTEDPGLAGGCGCGGVPWETSITSLANCLCDADESLESLVLGETLQRPGSFAFPRALLLGPGRPVPCLQLCFMAKKNLSNQWVHSWMKQANM